MMPLVCPARPEPPWFHLGEGAREDVRCEWADLGKLIVRFRYSAKTHPASHHKTGKKRGTGRGNFNSDSNQKIVTRTGFRNYDIYFDYGDKRLKIEDPLGFR